VSDPPPLSSEPLRPLVERLAGEPRALLGLGIPRCPASELLAASLAEIAWARPSTPVGYALLAGPEDWALREEVLWPRDIQVSRSSVPSLCLMREGHAAARRLGGGPAAAIDAWLCELLGPAERELAGEVTERERRALSRHAARSAQHVSVKDSDRRGPG